MVSVGLIAAAAAAVVVVVDGDVSFEATTVS